MNRFTALAVSTVVLAALALDSGAAVASGGGSSDTWPAAAPLPTSPGTVVSQSRSTAVIQSTDTVASVQGKLDALYLTGKGCTSRSAVNKPRDYFCANASTGKTDEIWFTFASLDPTPSDPSRSQTNGFYVEG
jgi:hypothetical protein